MSPPLIEPVGRTQVMNQISVYLESKRNPSFSPVFLGSKLGGDAVYLDEDPRLPGRVPGEGYGAQVGTVLLHLGYPVAEREVHLDNPLVGMRPRPLLDLFILYVLESTLVKTYSYCTSQPFLLVITRQITQLLYL